MDRHRIVHAGADTAVGEVRAQVVPSPPGDAHDVAVEDVAAALRDLRRDDPAALQAVVVLPGDRDPAGVPLPQPAQLDAQDGGLDLVEAGALADRPGGGAAA